MLLKIPPRVSAEQLIRSGVLFYGDRDFPSTLARFLATRKPRRRYSRPGVVGNIDGIGAATASQLALAWAASRAAGLPNTINATGPNSALATNLRQPVKYTIGTTGAGTINQVAQKTILVTNGAPQNVTMDIWPFNVIGDVNATFSAIREMWIELLSIAQGGGASASDITLGGHATNAWSAVLTPGATALYKLKLAGLWLIQDQTAVGLPITAGDFLKILNNDAGNIASVRMTAVGYK
jgi:stage V sporulation protein SpoVS